MGDLSHSKRPIFIVGMSRLGRVLGEWLTYLGDRRRLSAEPPAAPILVTGTSRSGSTWVGHMLHTPGVRYYREPLGQFVGMRCPELAAAGVGIDERGLSRMVEGILQGGDAARTIRKYSCTGRTVLASRFGPWRLLRNPCGRVLIKDPTVALGAEWLANHYDMAVVVLFRHPCNVVSSFIRLDYWGWEAIERVLACDDLMALGLERHRKLLQRAERMTRVQQYAVRHAMVNQVLWRALQEHPNWLNYKYEELCDKPVARFKQMFDRLGLRYGPAVKVKHIALTTGSDADDRFPYGTRADSRRVGSVWKKRLTLEQVAQIRWVWERFEVPLYTRDDDWEQ